MVLAEAESQPSEQLLQLSTVADATDPQSPPPPEVPVLPPYPQDVRPSLPPYHMRFVCACVPVCQCVPVFLFLHVVAVAATPPVSLGSNSFL